MAFNPENKKITEAVKKTPDLPKKGKKIILKRQFLLFQR